MFTDHCVRISGRWALYLGAGPLPAQAITARWIYSRVFWRLYARVKGPGIAGVAQFLKMHKANS